MNRRGLILFTALSLIWGLPYLFIKYAVAELDPTVIVIARTLPASIVLLGWSAYRGKLKASIPYWRAAVLFAAAEMMLPWWLINEAERTLSSGLTGLLLATVPLFGLVVAQITGGSDAKPSNKRLLGLGIGIVGVAALVGVKPEASGITFASVTMVMVAALGYAIGPAVIKNTLGKADSAALIGMAWASCPRSTCRWWPPTYRLTCPAPRAVTSMVVLTLICTIAAFLVFFALIDSVGPVSATLVTFINPAVAVALGTLFLHEAITPGLIIGFPLVLGGSWLASQK